MRATVMGVAAERFALRHLNTANFAVVNAALFDVEAG
jgi:hypothetical protein